MGTCVKNNQEDQIRSIGRSDKLLSRFDTTAQRTNLAFTNDCSSSSPRRVSANGNPTKTLKDGKAVHTSSRHLHSRHTRGLLLIRLVGLRSVP
jgi:hypothetical protein